MRSLVRVLALACLAALVSASSVPALDKLCSDAAQVAMQKFPTLKPEELGVAMYDLRKGAADQSGSFQGGLGFYPASTVKLFFLAASHQFVQEGRFPLTEQLSRGLHDMIVYSDNEATQYVLEAITDSPNGMELPAKEWVEWKTKRSAVNAFFLGQRNYTGVNAVQKTYNSGPYGRDNLWLEGGKNRNLLSASAAARLMSEIALHSIVTPARCDAMLGLLSRNMSAPLPPGGEDENHSFTALALDPKTDKLWSKAGWTTSTRHDIAYVERPKGVRVVIATYTLNHALEKWIIPTVAKHILDHLPAV